MRWVVLYGRAFLDAGLERSDGLVGEETPAVKHMASTRKYIIRTRRSLENVSVSSSRNEARIGFGKCFNTVFLQIPI